MTLDIDLNITFVVHRFLESHPYFFQSYKHPIRCIVIRRLQQYPTDCSRLWDSLRTAQGLKKFYPERFLKEWEWHWSSEQCKDKSLVNLAPILGWDIIVQKMCKHPSGRNLNLRGSCRACTVWSVRAHRTHEFGLSKCGVEPSDYSGDLFAVRHVKLHSLHGSRHQRLAVFAQHPFCFKRSAGL